MDAILDFGEKGFPGILVETIAIFINNLAAPANTKVFSLTHRLHLTQPQAYIFDPELPYWIIYRNQLFDSVCRKLDFDVFEVFRDRQLTNKLLSSSGELRVLKSRNLSDDGKRFWTFPDTIPTFLTLRLSPFPSSSISMRPMFILPRT